MTAMAQNEAETLFETYLASQGLVFAYEQEAGDGRRPDYWVETAAGVVVCEVRHVTASISNVLGGTVGSLDPYRPLARAVKAKSRQGRGLAGVHPYVVVLWAPGWDVSDFAVSGALFGNLTMVMPLDSDTATADTSQVHTEFGRDAVMHHDERAHISAVAILRQFNPTLRAAQDEIAHQLDDVGRGDIGTSVPVIQQVFQRREADGTFEPDLQKPRLVTYHNPQATKPLDRDVFNGPFDQQWAPMDGEYRQVAAGRLVESLPH